MKKILTLIILLNSLLLASSVSDNEKERKERLEKQILIEIEKEKKYSKEQTFYTNDNYDFKGSEVNPDSIDSVPEIEVDDFDMDSVYD
ncbi:MAG: hypothetical protein U9P72_06950 [Campylobacterota bacterium]|nr:hypothetical protein [Campylobacterota bacterium]